MIGLLGSGSWATAIVKILLEKKDRKINWWVREEEAIPTLLEEKHNPLYLSEAYIDTSRTNISSDINEVIRKSDDIYIVIPSAFIHRALKDVSPILLQSKRYISAVKGIVPEFTAIITEYLREQMNIDYSQMCIISGPSHAEEAARQKLTYLTVASTNKDFAEQVRRQISCQYIKTTYSTDMTGIECAAVLKNIYAIAAGLCRGLGYGDNIIAVLISNALQEMTDFMQTISPIIGDGDFNADARLRQFESFAYLGDLLVTSYSQFSRNRTFGNMLGYGYSIKAAQLEMKMVAEGYYAVDGIEKIRRQQQLHMPIVEAVYAILYAKKSPAKIMKRLLENLH
ncbi:MAG: NAD(P)H-dependent glycerol-3-phosphate dehydrogenase [Bacteroidales bacterium]|jgi:glycerol-3-phosphate dehydrogenase (NAD(P)+)|nr:NAD(P)H-dependent glycerol-3-phosphate dehydrogenase [Bacteroidales bacterium]